MEVRYSCVVCIRYGAGRSRGDACKEKENALIKITL